MSTFSDALKYDRPLGRALNQVSRWRWWWRSERLRWGLGLRYAMGLLDRDSALTMMWECERVSGCYALVSLDDDYVLERAQERWKDCPELAGLTRDATARVASKYEDQGDTAYYAGDWALQKVEEYAIDQGVTLVEIDEGAEDAA